MRLGLALVLLASAPLHAGVFWVLGAGNQTQNGVAFVTELHVTNNSPAPANVQLSFVPSGSPALGLGMMTVAPAAPLSFGDVLNQAWGLTESGGVLRISSDQPVLISASRHAASGLAGTDLAVIAEEDFLQAGDVGDALWVSESGDPTAGISTRFQVYLADSNVTADLRVYDQDGNLLASSPVSGGPGLFDIAASSLLTSPVAVGRAELRVSGGRAAAMVEMRDNQTGDPMAMSFTGPGNATSGPLLSGVMHSTLPSGTQIETDARVFNPSTVTQTAIFFDFHGHTASMAIPPHGIREVADVAGFLLKGAAGGAAAIQVNTTTSTLLVAGRTTAVAAGSPGIYGEIHAAMPTDPGIPPALVTEVYGLPTGVPTGSILARTDNRGGSWQAVVIGPAGETLASSGTMALTASQTLESTLSDLFGSGITIPDGAHLEVWVTSGTVETEYLRLADVSADPIYREATRLPVPGCASPSIDFLTADKVSLAAPGNATVSWSVTLADSVDLSPVTTGLGAAGSQTLAVASSTTYQLTAHNSCGDTVAPILITVGPPNPNLVGIVSADGTVSGTSAAPGQLIRIHVDNIADPTAIDGVVFGAPDASYTEEPESVSDGGDVDVRVPFWVDSKAAGGYRKGDMTLAVSASGAVTGALPITIQALSFTGDPVAEFGKLIDNTSATGSAFLASLDPSLADVAAAQKAYVAQVEASLRKMLASVSAAGSASIAWGAEPPAPDAVSATITKDDLTNLMAYQANLTATSGSASLGALARFQPALGGNPLNCLAARPPYTLITPCKALKAGEALSKQMQDYLSLLPQDLVLDYAKNKVANGAKQLLAKYAAGAALNKLKGWLRVLEILCLVEPITLKGFMVTPTRFPDIPRSSKSETTQVLAQMVSAVDDQQIMADIEKAEINRYLKELGKSVQLNSTEKTALTAFLTELLQDANNGLDTALTQIAKKAIGASPSRPPQVGSCDLQNFYPMTNGEFNQFTAKSFLERGYVAPQGDLDYFYIGRRSGKEVFCIRPYTDNFLFPDDLEFSKTALNTSKECRYTSKPVTIPRVAVGATPRLSTPTQSSNAVFSEDISIGDADGTVGVAASVAIANYNDFNNTSSSYSQLDGYSSPSGAGLINPLPEIRSVSAGSAMATINVTQTSPTTWSGSMSMNYLLQPDPKVADYVGVVNDGIVQLWLKYQIPINRDDSQAVHIQVNSDPSCKGGFSSGANALDINNKLTVMKCPAPMSCAETTAPTWAFDSTGALSGTLSINMSRGTHTDPGDSGACTIKFGIQVNR